ncbi:enoyl-CoA hydratase-related protein [Micromonospora sp. NPDC005113]
MNEILLEVSGGVAVVTLNAPQRRNAMTSDMAKEFSGVLRAVGRDAGVVALVVRGAGQSFCAGADRTLLSRAAEDPLSERSRAEIAAVYRAFTDLGELAIPSIAAVHGPAVGAGLNLAMAATIRIVSEDALFLSGFHRLGLHPGGGHLHLLARSAGRQAAAALALFNQPVPGADAVAKGLAWDLVSGDRLLDRCLEVARAVSGDRELVRVTLASLELSEGPPQLPWPAALELERGAQQWSMSRTGRDA